MTQDIYKKLGERLNRFEGKNPLVESFFKILEQMYAVEEAQLAVDFPDGLYTARELAKFLGRNEGELKKLLEIMADKGTAFTERSETGELRYELIPYVPGAIEYYILRRLDKPEEIKNIMALSEKMREEAGALFEKVMAEDPAKLSEMVSSEPHFRILTVNEALPSQKQPSSFENVMELIETQTSFSAMVCTCREGIGPNTTGPCKAEGVPEYSCLCFGKTADFLVERKFAKRITKEESRDIISTCNKAGLVLNVNNFVDDLQFVCNCCSCCCGVMNSAKTLGPAIGLGGILNTSNFTPVVDTENCTACGECEERCPLDAIAVSEDAAAVNPDMCIGCGHCAAVCPVECISMERTADKKPELGDRKVGFGF
jgi:Na+-translocating ferredoxin:NAD+ oxidoreductase subunit B